MVDKAFNNGLYISYDAVTFTCQVVMVAINSHPVIPRCLISH